jgi:GTP-binding protein
MAPAKSGDPLVPFQSAPEKDSRVPSDNPKRDGTALVVKQLEFLGGMASADGWRPADSTLPEIAFAGRSNVGKSSLLNVLLRRKGAARVSRTPGRTREINFFRVNDAFILVDLPGYGYAKVARERRAEWRPLIEEYLKRSPALKGLVLLLDARRDPSDDDRAMLEFLADRETPVLVAITKMDKFGSDAGLTRVQAIAAALDLDADQVVPVSARTGLGRDDLAAALMTLITSDEARE